MNTTRAIELIGRTMMILCVIYIVIVCVEVLQADEACPECTPTHVDCDGIISGDAYKNVSPPPTPNIKETGHIGDEYVRKTYRTVGNRVIITGEVGNRTVRVVKEKEE